MTPKGHHNSILDKLYARARHGDLPGLDAYLASRDFAEHRIAAGPKVQASIMRSCANARARCERLYRLAHPQPTVAPLQREKDGQVKWTAPGMVEVLRAAYARARDDEEAARILGVSRGAAQIARKRYLDVAPTQRQQEPA